MCFFDCCIPTTPKRTEYDADLDKIAEQFEIIRRNAIMRKGKIVNDAMTKTAKKHSVLNTMYYNAEKYR